MNFKINKKASTFTFAIIFLVLAIITMYSTYARYVTSMTATSTIELGSWLIKVNNQNILNNSDISGTITPVFDGNSEYIAEGVIAPGSSGHIEVTVDYSKVTVPFKYDVSFTTDENTPLEDFVLTGYSVDDGALVEVDDPNYIITDTIFPDYTARSRKLKLTFGWLDEVEGENLNDIEDTAFSRNNDELGLRLTMEFTQLQPTT